MEIISVTNRRLLRLFIDFPHTLYKNDPNYVPELYITQKHLLTSRNPFFEHSEAAYFLAFLNGKVAGRIAAIQNNVHNQRYKNNAGFFGFFEVIQDYEVCRILFNKVAEWFRSKQIYRIVGPTNLTTNDSCGVLISGFELSPIVMMPYNKKYYDDFLSRYGFVKEMDLSSYLLDGIQLKSLTEKPFVSKIQDKLREGGIVIRPINFKNFDEEVNQLRKVYNESNAGNWGFMPLNDKEFRCMAKEIKKLVPANLVLIVEKANKQIGFIVAVPDYNQVLRYISRGRLLPFGFLKFLWYRSKINSARILILGVCKEYTNRGIDLLLYKIIQENLNTIGIYGGEACYVMEDNNAMNSILKKIGGKLIKKYRIYKMNISIKSDKESYNKYF
jgi:hypothetical protein